MWYLIGALCAYDVMRGRGYFTGAMFGVLGFVSWLMGFTFVCPVWLALMAIVALLKAIGFVVVLVVSTPEVAVIDVSPQDKPQVLTASDFEVERRPL